MCGMWVFTHPQCHTLTIMHTCTHNVACMHVRMRMRMSCTHPCRHETTSPSPLSPPQCLDAPDHLLAFRLKLTQAPSQPAHTASLSSPLARKGEGILLLPR